jgi:signal transduction histidine kinase
MAANSMEGADPQRAAEAREVLLEEISRLDELARSFSQFGTMPEGPPSEIDLPELLEGLAERHRDIGPTIDLEIDGPLPFVVGHFDALQRCFRNLLLNALEASGKEGSVEIRTWREGNDVVTEIRDSGPGIAEEALDRMWDPDFTTKSKGTGLGLPLVRQTIMAHEGNVEGRNHLEVGAVFRVVLPIER